MPLHSPVANLPKQQEKQSRPDSVDDLTQLEQDTWQQLASALTEEGDGFKTMTLSTCTSRGADARMVVLRQVDGTRKYVWFHTDARSEKVLQLEAFPMATLLFWDDQRQIQLRLTIETRLHTWPMNTGKPCGPAVENHIYLSKRLAVNNPVPIRASQSNWVKTYPRKKKVRPGAKTSP